MFTLLAVAASAHDASEAELSPIDRLLSGDHSDVLVMPHRGWWRHAPENSLLSIELALDAGMPLIEIDVRMTSDDEFVVIHDKTLDRTTTGSGRVDEHTLDQIRELRLLNGYGLATDQVVPTLSEVMALCKGRAAVYIDKSEAIIANIAARLKDQGMLSHAVFYGTRPLAELRTELGPLFEEIFYIPKVDPNHPGAIAYVDAFLTEPSVPAFVVNFKTDSPHVDRLCAHIRSQGKRIMMAPLWPSLVGGRTDDRALEDPEVIYGWMLDRGASIICTDRPGRVLEFVARRRPQHAAVEP